MVGEATTGPPGSQPDVLRTGEAGGKYIRGGVVRGASHVLGVALAIGASALLLRHLGVEDFGRYGAVAALLGIVLGLTDAGLSAVGSREIAVRPPGPERERILAALATIRLVTTTVGVLGAIGFALVAYDGQLVLGAALVGISVIVTSLQSVTTIALAVALRITPIAAFETLRNGLTLVGIAALVAAGAGLVPFFAVQIVVTAIVLVATVRYVRRDFRLGFGRDLAEIRWLVRETLPMSLAVTMNVLYVGAMTVLVSLLRDERTTGLYAVSARIMEVLVTFPALVLSLALPILAVAGHEDLARMRQGLQKMVEVGLLVATLAVVAVTLTADSVVDLLGGAEYAGAGGVLRIQVIALLGVFVTQTIQLALIAQRRQRALVVANAGGLALLLGLGVAFVEAWGAKGAAIAVIVAEACLAGLLLLLLARSEPGVAPRFGFVWKLAVAGGVGALAVFLPGHHHWLEGVLGGAAYLLVAFVLRAVPPELRDALVAPLAGRATAAAVRDDTADP